MTWPIIISVMILAYLSHGILFRVAGANFWFYFIAAAVVTLLIPTLLTGYNAVHNYNLGCTEQGKVVDCSFMERLYQIRRGILGDFLFCSMCSIPGFFVFCFGWMKNSKVKTERQRTIGIE